VKFFEQSKQRYGLEKTESGWVIHMASFLRGFKTKTRWALGWWR
jgi:hypothetical protein